MTIPHWGPPTMPTDTAGSYIQDSTGCWLAGEVDVNKPTSPVVWQTSSSGGPQRFQFDNVTYRGVCGSDATVVPGVNELQYNPSAIVVNVTSITNSNVDRGIAIYMSTCDGTVTLSTTKPGVFVLKGSSVAIFVERWYGSEENRNDGCPGESFLAFTTASLEDHCQVDSGLAACGIDAPKQSTATTTKRSKAVLVVLGVLVALVPAVQVYMQIS